MCEKESFIVQEINTSELKKAILDFMSSCRKAFCSDYIKETIAKYCAKLSTFSFAQFLDRVASELSAKLSSEIKKFSEKTQFTAEDITTRLLNVSVCENEVTFTAVVRFKNNAKVSASITVAAHSYYTADMSKAEYELYSRVLKEIEIEYMSYYISRDYKRLQEKYYKLQEKYELAKELLNRIDEETIKRAAKELVREQIQADLDERVNELLAQIYS